MKYFLYGEVSLKKAIDRARVKVDALKTFSCTLDERWVYKRAPGAQDEEQQGRPGGFGAVWEVWERGAGRAGQGGAGSSIGCGRR